MMVLKRRAPSRTHLTSLSVDQQSLESWTDVVRTSLFKSLNFVTRMLGDNNRAFLLKEQDYFEIRTRRQNCVISVTANIINKQMKCNAERADVHSSHRKL